MRTPVRQRLVALLRAGENRSVQSLPPGSATWEFARVPPTPAPPPSTPPGRRPRRSRGTPPAPTPHDRSRVVSRRSRVSPCVSPRSPPLSAARRPVRPAAASGRGRPGSSFPPAMLAPWIRRAAEHGALSRVQAEARQPVAPESHDAGRHTVPGRSPSRHPLPLRTRVPRLDARRTAAGAPARAARGPTCAPGVA